MSSFVCDKCGADIIDTPTGYVTGCEHSPLETDEPSMVVTRKFYEQLQDDVRDLECYHDQVERLKARLAEQTSQTQESSTFWHDRVMDALERQNAVPAGNHFETPIDQVVSKAVRLLKGTIDAQDEREHQAGEVCGIPYAEHGCDWPDWVAERVVHLRKRVAELEAQVRHWKSAHDHVVVKKRKAAEVGKKNYLALQQQFFDATGEVRRLDEENQRLRRALKDAINRPKGVVPDSALEFYK